MRPEPQAKFFWYTTSTPIVVVVAAVVWGISRKRFTVPVTLTNFAELCLSQLQDLLQSSGDKDLPALCRGPVGYGEIFLTSRACSRGHPLSALPHILIKAFVAGEQSQSSLGILMVRPERMSD